MIYSSKKPQILINFKGVNSLSANATKWPNTLKQFVGKLPTNCLSMFDHFVKLALKGLITFQNILQRHLCLYHCNFACVAAYLKST